VKGGNNPDVLLETIGTKTGLNEECSA